MSVATPIVIGPGQLALTLVFVLLAGLVSMAFRLELTRSLAVGTVRTFAQLFLMGYALKYIFALEMGLPVVAVFAAMVAAAAHIVHGRVPERDVAFGLPVFGAMIASYMLVATSVTGVIIGAKPWWEPQYFLPLGGMIAGNSMNALAIALERLFSGLRRRRAEVEMKLTLGADYREASDDIVREAIRAGMIPSINSMMGVGLVSIPGMMTGQIIAGADPSLACRYQIVVMLMLVASTAISAVVVVWLARKLCFGRAHQLLLRPEND
ncbi:putative ABC transport system permease protein [Desulfobaculum xiamenense]|uniref:Putative ABC transport system permease protein n=1 Tax=Desulfobaculum xiamenense TaxID=995050 RepID=A0A846QMA3_9BACT|nr:iron export ABC transporter permease subunit FetB [Desulfobaculum xiamenense]NJB68317.1 putative ABC transport system permease protein [Desulfobaculum xiamenense]